MAANGRLVAHQDVDVTECEVNPAIDPAEFDIPVDVLGMLVSDSSAEPERRPVSYIVREDGTRLMLDLRENLTYEEALQRDRESQRNAALRPLWFGLGTLVVAVVVIWIYTRLRGARLRAA
jgi:hypothetical protein